MIVLQRLLEAENMKDSCRSLDCGEERIDRILFRGNDMIKLKAIEYKVEVQRFEKSNGRQMSDHEAVSTVFEWSVK